MPWRLIVSISIPILFLLLYILGKYITWGKLFEAISIFWFRLACSFLLLFIIHLIIGYNGYALPINLFSALTIAIFGVPGVLGVVFLNYFL